VIGQQLMLRNHDNSDEYVCTTIYQMKHFNMRLLANESLSR
jgi:hypothetical protein